MTRREEMVQLLKKECLTAYDLACRLQVKIKIILDDLTHIQKSIKHKNEALSITPAACRTCGFLFGKEEIKTPSKCPKCRSEWIDEQAYSIEQLS